MQKIFCSALSQLKVDLMLVINLTPSEQKSFVFVSQTIN